MHDHFRMMSGYNAWANQRLYAAAAAMPEDDYRREYGAFFGSVHRTLNHLLGADRIWMKRFTGSGEAPDRLDAVLHDSLPALAEARRAEDARIIAYVEGLDAAALAGRFRYRTISRPTEIEQPLAPALTHFFNHQTHHRGQVHCLMTQLVGKAPELDLIFFQRETGVGLS
jgi:uncharacterized damage-inducible protein DinB